MFHRDSLNHHLNTYSKAPNDLRHLLLDIARAAKYIQFAIRTTEAGLAGTKNQFDEHQVKLDVLSDDIIKDELTESELVASYISEEQSEEVRLKEDAPYSVAFDPLDGSSLVDVGFAIGSIFSVYEGQELIGRKISEQVAALYVLYGPRTLLTYSTGKGVHTFLLNDVGEFVLIKEDIRIADECTNYSPGNLQATKDNPGYAEMLKTWLASDKTLRYSGCMAADVHHIFAKGQGIFCNVGGKKYPQGKLRLVFECGPFSYLAEHAGGQSCDGKGRIMDRTIETIDERTPIIIGSANEVKRVCDQLKS